MGSLPKDTDSLPTPNTLLSSDHRGVLDTIDSLRSKGITRYIDLPQIIVCGDQSSGKSSVLEAISGLSFPTKDALCTRFATELVLRRGTSTTAKATILPGPDRTDSERSKLSSFRHTSPGDEDLDLSAVVSDAQELMGLNGTDRVFSTDILRVELTSPTQPHLTLVDLPGLFLAGNKTQSVEDARVVEALVLSYMRQPRSIILAVVSAKSEFALQQVTQRAREQDPEGRRTLGLITKPDTLDDGSDSQTAYLELARNRDVELRHGWHVVRNRDFKTRNASRAERDAAEQAFFAEGVWSSLDPAQLGVGALTAKLSRLLYDHTLSNMGQVLGEVDAGLVSCRQALDRLGEGRDTTRDQTKYLVHIGQAFKALVDAAVRGDYHDPAFFGPSASGSPEEGGSGRRLRARVQNTLLAFSEEMAARGRAVDIVDHASQTSETARPRRVLRSEYVSQAAVTMAANRGRELPGSYNPLIVRELFAAQCAPWQALAQGCIESVLAAAQTTLQAAVEHVADGVTASRILRDVVEPALGETRRAVQDKLDELLDPHVHGHPITYNINFITRIQQAKTARQRKGLLDTFYKYVEIDEEQRDAKTYSYADMEALYHSVEEYTMPDLEYGAAETAVDVMEEYYNVAFQTFTDEVAVLAVERCVVARLGGILDDGVILDMDEEEIRALAGESPETVALRRSLEEKLGVLEAGKRALGRLGRA